MIFAKIDYINLLPFHVYFKKNIRENQTKAIINYKKSYPADINKKLKKRKVDAGFISSIESKGKKSLDFGIIAKKDVLSVLAIKGEYQKDFESGTSNVLAKILKINGKIIIGDKALKYYHSAKGDEFIDLAQAWNEKYHLPFVFARLCFNNHDNYLRKITKNFNKRAVKIPQYILKDYSKKTGISVNNIREYLKKIDYKLEEKEKKALKLFLRLSKKYK